MAKRSYGQYCALARAFDVIGERWTPLLLRELAMGPRRYADLLEGLPGVGTSLLAQRLRELEAEGVIRKAYLPPPAARQVYELTEDGRELTEALLPIARWGVKRLGARRRGEAFSLSWLLLFLRSAADPAAAKGVHDVYQFHLGKDVFHITVDEGHIDALPGAAPRPPDLVVRTDLETFTGLGSGALQITDARVTERMRVDGDPKAAQRCLRVLLPFVEAPV